MSLPTWWPRTRCVYCGALIRERDPISSHRRISTLACWRHVALLELDPEYT